MKQLQQGADDTISQWVTFRLGNESYGIAVMCVQEVLRVTDIAPVPGAPSYVLGIINLRGNVVTVIDTRKRFSMEYKEPDDASRIIVVELGDIIVGLLVDSVSEVAYIMSSKIESTPNVGNENGSRFIQGVSNRDTDLLILIDLDKLLTDEELKDLAIH